MRLTKRVRDQLLAQNEGFEATTHYSAKNFRESRRYTITDGQLRIRSTGKTSWADSRFDREFAADDDQVRRFLRDNMHRLDISGLD